MQGRTEEFTYEGTLPWLVYTDFALPAGETFLVDVENGNYQVEFLSNSVYKSSVTGTVEDKSFSVSNAANTYAVTSVDVEVTDGQLTMTFGSNTPRLGAIVVRKAITDASYYGPVDDEPTVPVGTIVNKYGSYYYVLEDGSYYTGLRVEFYSYSQLEAALAELESARTQLDYTTICSPVDGTIGMIEYRVGDLVETDGENHMVIVSDNNNLHAYGALSEETLSELLKDFNCNSADELLEKLPPVTFYSNWGYKLEEKGHIDVISGTIDLNNGATYIRASFHNPTERLRNGSNGYIELPYIQHHVVVIPQEAVVDIHNKYLVYKVVDGKAVETEVTILP